MRLRHSNITLETVVTTLDICGTTVHSVHEDCIL